MFCQTAAPGGAALPTLAAKPKLNVLFGSQCGNAESIAKRLVKEAKKQGYEPTIVALEKVTPAALAQEKCALIVTSTWGKGDPPDNAVKFWEKLFSRHSAGRSSRWRNPLIRSSLLRLSVKGMSVRPVCPPLRAYSV